MRKIQASFRSTRIIGTYGKGRLGDSFGRGDDGGKSNTNEGKEEGSPAQTQTVTVVGGPGPSKGAAASPRKILFRRIVRRLANLKFAIGEIAVLAFMSALGTALEQNKAPDYYTSQLVEGHPIASDILGNVVLLLGFDHMYSSPLYLGLCALLTSSLMACSYNTQWPMVKVAQRWRFIEDPARVLKMSASHSIAASSEGSSPTSGALAVKKASREGVTYWNGCGADVFFFWGVL